MRAALTLATAGCTAVLLLLELVLRLLPVSTATMTGYGLDADVLTYPPGHTWTASTGWDLRNAQRLRANNWGFVSEREFIPDPRAVALIGDSYVEAAMLPAADRPGARLESLLGGRPVYALGSPGTALIDHAQRLRLASERLQVRDVVIWLERGDARQSLCGSGNVHSRCLDPQSLAPRVERLPPPTALKRWARHSALAQYFLGQLKLQPAELRRALFTRVTPAEPTTRVDGKATPASGALAPHARAMIDAVVDRFFIDASPYLQGRLLFVIDGRRSGSVAAPTSDDLERAHLIAQLRSRGADVIDLEPAYAQHAATSRRSLEVGPYDAHLNAQGVQLVMGQVARWFERGPTSAAVSK
jgi:hypothetical protein